jgi:acetylornithine deacetylase/succinyl-diaminopimelate desuccinylase-like protein
VSADLDDVEIVADAIVEKLECRGVDARLIRREGLTPLATGRIEAGSDRPTIGVYAHWDGQPVDQAGWLTDPFAAVAKSDGRIVDDPASRAFIDPEWRCTQGRPPTKRHRYRRS